VPRLPALGERNLRTGRFTYANPSSATSVIWDCSSTRWGGGLAFRSGIGVLLTALLIMPVLARIGAEEALLRSQFGDEYVEYCARMSRLIPGLY
jgi:protein-S-isoprenylcysteine O-methyltransferase Ste14